MLRKCSRRNAKIMVQKEREKGIERGSACKFTPSPSVYNIPSFTMAVSARQRRSPGEREDCCQEILLVFRHCPRLRKKMQG